MAQNTGIAIPNAETTVDYFVLQDDNARTYGTSWMLRDIVAGKNSAYGTSWQEKFSACSGQLGHWTFILSSRFGTLQDDVLAALNTPPRNLATLSIALDEQWLALPTELIDHTFNCLG
ncbi:hypothetical protein TNCV_3093681 [Trichonephila clavipes]|nr:hypothetical protein TNCV_3093681 [Trichonephila clavipes]